MVKLYNLIYSLISSFRYKIFNFFSIPLAKKEFYLKIHNDSKSKKYQIVDEFEKKYNFSINKEWFEELALNTQVVIKKSDINYQHGRLLYSLLMNYISNQSKKLNYIQIFETGTARGFSAICMAKALIDSRVNGNITTIDILPHTQKMLWNCIADCNGVSSRDEILNFWEKEKQNVTFLEGKSSEVIKRLNLKRIHFAFLDAHHVTREVINEYKFVENKQIKGDIIFFDDVTPSLYPGVVNAINIIKKSDIYSIEYIFLSSQRQYAIARKK